MSLSLQQGRPLPGTWVLTLSILLHHFDNLLFGSTTSIHYIYKKEVMKIYCRSCERVTKHRQKGLRNPVNVCNKCDITNMPVRLIKSNGETHLAKQVQFIEWSGEELGSRGKKLHDEPQIGFSCIMDPQYGYSYTWLTTPITEIVSDKTEDFVRIIEFQTKNSKYNLYIYSNKLD